MTDLLPVGATTVFDQLPDDFDQWAAYGLRLQAADTAVNWAIGDWVLFGEAHWPDRYLEAAAATGLAQKTIANAVTVASRIPPDRRRADVPWSAHAEVVSLSPDDQARLLGVAATEGLSVRALRAVVQQEVQDRTSPDVGRGAAPNDHGAVIRPDDVQMPEPDNSVRAGTATERPPQPAKRVQVLSVEVPDGQAEQARRFLDDLIPALSDRMAAIGIVGARIEVR